MSTEEATKVIELVIREPVDKVVEKVGKKVEELSDIIGIDDATVKPIITEAAVVTKETVTTVINVMTTNEVVQKSSLKMISESSLTEDQKKLASHIYDPTKKALEGFILDKSINNTVKITKTIGQTIKQLESVKVDGKAPTGKDKKMVAIHLGRILIKEVTPDDKGEAEILMVYDLIAEPTLEAMIDVSKVVNTAVQEIAAKCCPSIFDLLKRVLRK
jgi:plasmid maintenance system antidote protein VapI